MQYKDSLSLVIPAFNEGENLIITVNDILVTLRSHEINNLEWIIVDDGSSDDTWSKMVYLTSIIPNVKLQKHDRNRGLGTAIWTGMKASTSKWCTWLPADGQISPFAILDMMSLTEDASAVLLMRREVERTLMRKIITYSLYYLMRLLFGVKLYGYSGVYLIKRDIFEEVKQSSESAIQNYALAIYCQKNGYKVQQVFTEIQPRMAGSSKVLNLRTLVKSLYETVKLRILY